MLKSPTHLVLPLYGQPKDAQKREKEEGKDSRFCSMFLFELSWLLPSPVPCVSQKPKLKLGKGKRPASNAVDTTFKARCKHTVTLRMDLLY